MSSVSCLVLEVRSIDYFIICLWNRTTSQIGASVLERLLPWLAKLRVNCSSKYDFSIWFCYLICIYYKCELKKKKLTNQMNVFESRIFYEKGTSSGHKMERTSFNKLDSWISNHLPNLKIACKTFCSTCLLCARTLRSTSTENTSFFKENILLYFLLLSYMFAI